CCITTTATSTTACYTTITATTTQSLHHSLPKVVETKRRPLRVVPPVLCCIKCCTPAGGVVGVLHTGVVKGPSTSDKAAPQQSCTTKRVAGCRLCRQGSNMGNTSGRKTSGTDSGQLDDSAGSRERMAKLGQTHCWPGEWTQPRRCTCVSHGKELPCHCSSDAEEDIKENESCEASHTTFRNVLRHQHTPCLSAKSPPSTLNHLPKQYCSERAACPARHHTSTCHTFSECHHPVLRSRTGVEASAEYMTDASCQRKCKLTIMGGFNCRELN
ncbi:hypothetical protein O3P69_019238, partial [Scylla paramamosain]